MSPRQDTSDLARVLNDHLHPLNEPTSQAYSPLLDWIGNASVVLIGEASHGTHQFYQIRAEITRALIEQKGFNAVAVEADWPDAYRVNRYVQHRSRDENAQEALGDFQRFPLWMWRNQAVMAFVEWLCAFNQTRSEDQRVGFYGLDLYSLYTSLEAVIDYLDTVDPAAADKARYRYSCFDQFDQDPQQYGYAATFGVAKDCENETIEQLVELRQQALNHLRRDGFVAQDEQFYAEQNARLVRNAEQYYRKMFQGRNTSWNLRDRHMYETLISLADHVRSQTREPKIVVWAHNSHLGDARYTEMATRGELNLGQLVKEQYGQRSYAIGFTTYTGSVAAASDWGARVERKQLRPGLPDSYEALFHEVNAPVFMIDLRADPIADLLRPARLERAIGVLYRPETERSSHYFHAQLSQQFDAIIHVDESDALIPLEFTDAWEDTEVPETYPTGI